MRLEFVAGTLKIQAETLPEELAPFFVFDPRSGSFRARACDYAKIVLAARAAGLELRDDAADFSPVRLQFSSPFEPRRHQRLAYENWKKNGFRGVAALPTGAGKSFLALTAIYKLQRPTLVLAPTIDLLEQWKSLIEKTFNCQPGTLGGGGRVVRPITVATYDSAVIFMEFIGNKFALLVCDECHHLPGAVFRGAAIQCVAPYRLGLSATPESGDPERDAVLTDLVGSVVAEVKVSELEGSVLAEYAVRTVPVSFSDSELEEYSEARQLYGDFVRRNRISFSAPDGWRRFMAAVSTRPGGRRAFSAYLRQKSLACRSASKLDALWRILCRHAGERVIVFTADNAAAYHIGREFLLPVITHRTKPAERRDMLENFRTGLYRVLVTSKVLNEGVDVPEAAVGVVVSGSGSVREHVQRLGRILRAAPGKQAVLYELVTAGSGEEYTMRRRQNHDAYERKVRR